MHQNDEAFVPPGEIDLEANDSMTSITSSLVSTCESAWFRKRQVREEKRRREDDYDLVRVVSSVESDTSTSIESDISTLLLASIDARSTVIEAKWRPKSKTNHQSKSLNKSKSNDSSTKEETRSSPELSDNSSEVVSEDDENDIMKTNDSFNIDTFETDDEAPSLEEKIS